MHPRLESPLPSEPKQNLPQSQNEEELSESQLRALYDDEEIDRFLRLFSSFVTEVHLPDTPTSNEPSSSSLPKDGDKSSSVPSNSETADWVPPRDADSTSVERPPNSSARQYDSLSEYFATNYVIPILPTAKIPTPTFTIGQLRLTTQRLYLATVPVYLPFFQRLKAMATWEDPQTSLLYCSIFWFLWWHNLLGCALVLRILYSLLRRRIFAYPSLKELRRRRETAGRADDFAERMGATISAKGSGITEVWRLLRLVDLKKLGKKKAPKKHSKRNSTDEVPRDSDGESIISQDQDMTILDSGVEDDDEMKDIKQDMLCVLNELADLHERAHNLFIWRKPSASRTYLIVLIGVLFLVVSLPTKYIVKLAFFILGFLFWHVVPVIAALPPDDRKRLPPPLFDVPTNAQYAMHIISQRIAAGLDVRPKEAPKRKKPDNASDIDLTASATTSQTGEGSKGINWEKWGDRLATGISTVNDIKRLKPSSMASVWPPRHPLLPDVLGHAQPALSVETHTYPCQHSTSPGLITLTASSMYFTPVMSQKPKLAIPLNAVKGIKKAGLLKGLNVRWKDTADGKTETKEDTFMWVGGRDELFARLVGKDGTRWVNV